MILRLRGPLAASCYGRGMEEQVITAEENTNTGGASLFTNPFVWSRTLRARVSSFKKKKEEEKEEKS